MKENLNKDGKRRDLILFSICFTLRVRLSQQEEKLRACRRYVISLLCSVTPSLNVYIM